VPDSAANEKKRVVRWRGFMLIICSSTGTILQDIAEHHSWRLGAASCSRLSVALRVLLSDFLSRLPR
jgi:hypothetical protein